MTYTPKSLSEQPRAEVREVVEAAGQQRLVLYLGAGLSIPPPACGPTGAQVASRVRSEAGRLLGVEATSLETTTLEELSQRVGEHSPEALAELRRVAAIAFDFTGIEPNYGHEVAALLLREGLVELVTVNWDCGVERAGRGCGVAITGVANLLESVQLVSGLPVYKVHGCSTRPETLALTQAEVDKPQTWAVGRVQNALGGGMVAFVGLGTVGLYVKEPLAELKAEWAPNSSSVRVVDPHLSRAWRDALDEHTEDAYVQASADEFFDELARGIVLDALQLVAAEAETLAEHEEWGGLVVAGVGAIRDAFDDASADGAIRWWRDGVVDTEAGTPFITALPGRRSLLTVAQVVGSHGGTVEVRGVRGRQTVGTAELYFEIVSRPGAHINEVVPVVEHRLRRRREEGTYRDGRPIVAVIADAIGTFPAPTAPRDIAGGEADPSDVAAGPEVIDLRLVSAEDGVRGVVAV